MKNAFKQTGVYKFFLKRAIKIHKEQKDSHYALINYKT